MDGVVFAFSFACEVLFLLELVLLFFMFLYIIFNKIWTGCD